MIKVDQYIDCYAHSDGRVTDSENIEYPVLIKGPGWRYVTLKLLSGVLVTVSRYRLICSVFKPLPKKENPNDYSVNHFDGKHGNDAASNLQWVTPGENTLHATLLGARNKRPLIRAVKAGNKGFLYYWDLHDAVKQTGLSYEDVWESIRLKKPSGEYKFQHIPWNFKDNLQGRLALGKERAKFIRPIDVKNIETGEIKSYSSMGEFATELNLLITHIRIRISDSKNPKLLHKKYVLVDKGHGFDFLTEDVLEKLRNRGNKEVYAYNLETKEFKLYKSAYNFIKQLKCPKSSITNPLAAKGIGRAFGWCFCYLVAGVEEAKEKLLAVAQ